jgi:hypothetical protein
MAWEWHGGCGHARGQAPARRKTSSLATSLHVARCLLLVLGAAVLRSPLLPLGTVSRHAIGHAAGTAVSVGESGMAVPASAPGSLVNRAWIGQGEESQVHRRLIGTRLTKRRAARREKVTFVPVPRGVNRNSPTGLTGPVVTLKANRVAGSNAVTS